MEFFLPSILFLLVACGIVFFVLPRFGPLVLAVVTLVLLGLGIYNHYSMFESEYRLSSWQMGAVSYAPFIMIGALVLGIILYLLYLVPSGSNSSNSGSETPKLNLPAAGTATNAITEGVNNLLRKGQNFLGEPNKLGNNGARGNSNRNTNTNTNANSLGNNKKSFFENMNPFNNEGPPNRQRMN